jgi:hypothetical protein
MRAAGLPRNLRDPNVSTLEAGHGQPAKTNPRPAAGASCRDGSRSRDTKDRPQAWYRQVKETKCGGRDGRESERLVVPAKPGNLLPGTRQREGAVGAWNHWQETWRIP